jgi:hypothetical protein
LCWDSNLVPNINVSSATTPRAGLTHLFFYNINTYKKINTKKKGTQSKNEDGTNSFGVHTHVEISTKKKELNPKMKMVRTHFVVEVVT